MKPDVGTKYQAGIFVIYIVYHHFEIMSAKCNTSFSKVVSLFILLGGMVYGIGCLT